MNMKHKEVDLRSQEWLADIFDTQEVQLAGNHMAGGDYRCVEWSNITAAQMEIEPERTADSWRRCVCRESN